MKRRIAPGLIGLIWSAAVFAQEQSPTAFAAASVTLNTSDDHIVTINVGPGGRFAARGYTLVLLIQRAYGVMDWNVSGGPGWIRTDRFDVSANANVEGDLTDAQLRPRLQKLLADRFKLRLHQSSKEMSGYALVAAKDGPKVKPAADGVEHADTFRMNGAGLSGQGITMESLAKYAGGKLGLVAVDMTGLKGVYDLNVEWAVEMDSREAFRAAVFSALESRLGLQLVAREITIQMLVIDSVEKLSQAAN